MNRGTTSARMPLHFTTRRWICRVALVALCAGPTMGVLGWGASRRWPGHTADCCRAIERELGVAVAGRAATHPRPGVLALAELTVYEPESNATLAVLRDVTIQEAAGGRTIVVAEAEVPAEALDDVR